MSPNFTKPIIKEIFKLYGISSVNLRSDAGIPTGRGLASSSVFVADGIRLYNVWNGIYLKEIHKKYYKQFSQNIERYYIKCKLFSFLDVMTCLWTKRLLKVVLFQHIPLIEVRK